MVWKAAAVCVSVSLCYCICLGQYEIFELRFCYLFYGVLDDGGDDKVKDKVGSPEIGASILAESCPLPISASKGSKMHKKCFQINRSKDNKAYLL